MGDDIHAVKSECPLFAPHAALKALDMTCDSLTMIIFDDPVIAGSTKDARLVPQTPAFSCANRLVHISNHRMLLLHWLT